MPIHMSRRVFAIVFVSVGLALALGGVWWMLGHGLDDLDWVIPFFGVAVIVLLVGISLATDQSARTATTIVKQMAAIDPTVAQRTSAAPAFSPYRGEWGSVAGSTSAARVTPGRTSATATVIVVLACCAFTALTLPPLFAMPRWIEIEVVLGAWWTIWAVALAVLAHRGAPLDRDYALGVTSSPTNPDRAPVPPPERASRLRWFDCLDFLTADVECIAIVVVGAVIIGVALAATWLVVDLAVPFVFFVAFAGIQTALRRSLAASHRGDALRSALHGALWATAYLAPLVAVVGFAHMVLAR